MLKINLFRYLDLNNCLLVFDTLIKKTTNNKDEYLKSIMISPSSYRRAKTSGNKIGIQIVKELCQKFNYIIYDDKLIEQLENIYNDVYFSIYYKKSTSYDKYLEILEQWLEKRYIIFPIIKLLKLFILINLPTSPQNTLSENQDLYNEILDYQNFYSRELLEILEIIRVSFTNLSDNDLNDNYQNELSCYTLATKCYLKGKYIYSLYFAKTAKEKFIENENYKRVYYINLTLLACYNALGKYEDAYSLGTKQLYSLTANKNYEFEYTATRMHFLITCLALAKYDIIVSSLAKINKLSLTELVCYLLAAYKSNMKLYNDVLANTINIAQYEKTLKTISDYITNKNRKSDIELLTGINKNLLQIIKKNF